MDFVALRSVPIGERCFTGVGKKWVEILVIMSIVFMYLLSYNNKENLIMGGYTLPCVSKDKSQFFRIFLWKERQTIYDE